MTSQKKTEPDEMKPVIKKSDPLKCPSGFPQKKWDSWSDSAKQNHLKIVYGGDE